MSLGAHRSPLQKYSSLKVTNFVGVRQIDFPPKVHPKSRQVFAFLRLKPSTFSPPRLICVLFLRLQTFFAVLLRFSLSTFSPPRLLNLLGKGSRVCGGKTKRFAARNAPRKSTSFALSKFC